MQKTKATRLMIKTKHSTVEMEDTVSEKSIYTNDNAIKSYSLEINGTSHEERHKL